MAAPILVYTASDNRSGSEPRLKGAILQWCRMTSRPVPDLTVARPERGKPHFPSAPDIQFSVTHSGDFWACAVSNQTVGLDLQKNQPAQAQKIAHRFFHPQEAAYLDRNPDNFFLVWAAKESYVKWTGRGIDDHFSGFSVLCDERFVPPNSGLSFHFLPFQAGYTLCLCCTSGCEIIMEQLS